MKELIYKIKRFIRDNPIAVLIGLSVFLSMVNVQVFIENLKHFFKYPRMPIIGDNYFNNNEPEADFESAYVTKYAWSDDYDRLAKNVPMYDSKKENILGYVDVFRKKSNGKYYYSYSDGNFVPFALTSMGKYIIWESGVPVGIADEVRSYSYTSNEK